MQKAWKEVWEGIGAWHDAGEDTVTRAFAGWCLACMVQRNES